MDFVLYFWVDDRNYMNVIRKSVYRKLKPFQNFYFGDVEPKVMLRRDCWEQCDFELAKLLIVILVFVLVVVNM